MATERVKRLRGLVDLIERLPESPDRDRMLSEVRSRAVDVDTGVTPRSMLPLREPAPPPIVSASPKRARATSGARTVPSPPARPVAFARPVPAGGRQETLEVPLWADELSLEDALQPHVLARGNRAIAPWTLGLRG